MQSVAKTPQLTKKSFAEFHAANGHCAWTKESTALIEVRMNDPELAPTERVLAAIKYHSSRIHSTYACRERGGEPLTQKELAELLAMPKQTVNGAVARLRARGYLTLNETRMELETTPEKRTKLSVKSHKKKANPEFDAYFSNRYPAEAAEITRAEEILERYRELQRREYEGWLKASANSSATLWGSSFTRQSPQVVQSPRGDSLQPPPQELPVPPTRTSSPPGADSEGSVSLLYLEEEYKEEEVYIPTVVEVSTAAEIRASQNGMYDPPVGQSGARPEPPKTAAHLPQTKLEKSQTPNGDLFLVYWELFIRAGKALCDRDKELSLRTWLNYELPEQERIIRWTAEQMRDKWSSEAYTPLPQNNLRNKGWLRVTEGRSIRGPEASSERQVIEILKARGYR